MDRSISAGKQVLGYRTPHHTDKVTGSARLPQVSYVDAGGVQTPWPHPLPCLVLIDLTQLYKWYEECSYPWKTPAAIIWWVLFLEDLIQYWKKERKEEYLYSAFLHQGTHKALRHGSYSFTCRQHHACLSFQTEDQLADNKWFMLHYALCSSGSYIELLHSFGPTGHENDDFLSVAKVTVKTSVDTVQ